MICQYISLSNVNWRYQLPHRTHWTCTRYRCNWNGPRHVAIIVEGSFDKEGRQDWFNIHFVLYVTTVFPNNFRYLSRYHSPNIAYLILVIASFLYDRMKWLNWTCKTFIIQQIKVVIFSLKWQNGNFRKWFSKYYLCIWVRHRSEHGKMITIHVLGRCHFLCLKKNLSPL